MDDQDLVTCLKRFILRSNKPKASMKMGSNLCVTWRGISAACGTFSGETVQTTERRAPRQHHKIFEMTHPDLTAMLPGLMTILNNAGI